MSNNPDQPAAATPTRRPRRTKAQVEELQELAVRLRTRGQTYDDIARELSLSSRAEAYRYVTRGLQHRIDARKRAGQEADQLREQELDRLDHLMTEALAVLDRDHFALSNGKVVLVWRTEDGQALPAPDMLSEDDLVRTAPVRDDGPKLRAIETVLRISAQRARLLGLEAPVQVQQSGTVRFVLEGINTEALT